MKKKTKKIQVSPLFIGLTGVVMMVLIVIIGALTIGGWWFRDAQTSIVGLGSARLPYSEAAEIAARGRDYQLAEKLANKSKVLGLNTENQSLIWPEDAIKRDIDAALVKTEETPSAYLYLRLSYDYYRIRKFDKAKEMIAEAAKIDPNDELVKEFVDWGKSW